MPLHPVEELVISQVGAPPPTANEILWALLAIEALILSAISRH